MATGVVVARGARPGPRRTGSPSGGRDHRRVRRPCGITWSAGRGYARDVAQSVGGGRQMSADLVERVSGFSGLRVVVLGEAMLDCYLYGRADRLSSEAPVPIVALSDRVDSPGGAANTAVNV